MAYLNNYDYHKKVGDAFSSPMRINILDLLRDRACNVESIANHLNTSIANTSKHLKVLTDSLILNMRKDGNFRIYSMNPKASPLVNDFFKFTHENISELKDFAEGIKNNFNVTSYHLDDLDDLMSSNKVLIDVRPEYEFSENHIEGAVNIPLQDVYELMKKLPKDKQIIAYCRGPHCLISAEVAKILNDNGYNCIRLIEGYDEWRSASIF